MQGRRLVLLAVSLWLLPLLAGAGEPAARSGPAEVEIKRPRGMTWVVRQQVGGLVLVGSDERTDAYRGDTDAEVKLPILAIRREKRPKPPQLEITSRYQAWSGGTVALTEPVKGVAMASREGADALVAELLGPGWAMAEFHDGWGWNFWAYGEIPAGQRFWVYINDQPANPWNSAR